MRSRYIPVTYTVIVLCVAMYIFTMTSPLASQLVLQPAAVRQGQIYRVFTYAFLHGSMQHIIANIYSCFLLGSIAENYMGSRKYTALIVLSILGSAACIIALDDPNTSTVGFSGALFGMLGCYVVILIKTGLISDPNIRMNIIQTLLINAAISFLPGISLHGHLGGFITGILFGMIFVK